jgi:hypothetical protein
VSIAEVDSAIALPVVDDLDLFDVALAQEALEEYALRSTEGIGG